MKKEKITIISLSVILIFVLGYFLIDDVLFSQFEDMYSSGYQQGVEDSVSEILVKSENCDLVTITFVNFTRQLIDFDCFDISP